MLFDPNESSVFDAFRLPAPPFTLTRAFVAGFVAGAVLALGFVLAVMLAMPQ